MIADHTQRPAQRLDDVRLHDGRLYTLRLQDGTIVTVMAWSQRPGEDPWQLIGDHDTCPQEGPPPHLVVRPDGSFVRDEGFVPEDHDGDVRAIAEGLTVFDLVPADTLAWALWFRLIGHYDACPRCGGSDTTSHRALCHTPDGVPLFPSYSPSQWHQEIREHAGRCEGGIPPARTGGG